MLIIPIPELLFSLLSLGSNSGDLTTSWVSACFACQGGRAPLHWDGGTVWDDLGLV